MPPDSHAALADRVEQAAARPRRLLEPFFGDTAKEVLVALAQNPNLQDRDLLRLLQRKDLPREALQAIAAHKEAAHNYPVQLALARHPRTPRFVALPLLKSLYLFDLVRVSQTPGVPADIRLAAEEQILRKLETLPRGQKISLARRSSGRVAASLLLTSDQELIAAALDNPFLSEGNLLRLLALENLPRLAVESIARNQKWSSRYHLRLALVRNPLAPLARVLEFLPDLAVNDLREICLDRRMPEAVRKYVLAHCAKRMETSASPRSRNQTAGGQP
jgi:hypothetical protein